MYNSAPSSKQRITAVLLAAMTMTILVGIVLIATLLPMDLCTNTVYHYDGKVIGCRHTGDTSVVTCTGTAFEVSLTVRDLDPRPEPKQVLHQATVTLTFKQNCSDSALVLGSKCPTTLIGDRLQAGHWVSSPGEYCSTGTVISLNLGLVSLTIIGIGLVYLAVSIAKTKRVAVVTIATGPPSDDEEPVYTFMNRNQCNGSTRTSRQIPIETL